MILYPTLKYWHILLVILTVTFFNVRFWLFLFYIQRPSRWFRILPPIIDSILLIFGILLINVTGYVPFTKAAPWLSYKLVFLVFYIVFGVMALRAKSLGIRITGYILANLCVLFMVVLALYKTRLVTFFVHS